MWVVQIEKPVPGVKPVFFGFGMQLEADEFASSVMAHFDHDDPRVEYVDDPVGFVRKHNVRIAEIGSAQDVFPEWSF